jgi:hypothetical protein
MRFTIEKPRPGFVVGFILACLVSSTIAWAANRPETTTGAAAVAVLVDVAGQGVPLAGTVTDAGFTPTVATSPAAGSPGTGPTAPSYSEPVNSNGAALFATSSPGYVHELGPAPGAQTCVLCGAVTDGGTIPVVTGTRYVVDVIDSNGSAVTFAEGQAAVFATAPGVTKAPGSYQWTATAQTAPDAGTLNGRLTCVAQTATTSAPTGPWLCVAVEGQ